MKAIQLQTATGPAGLVYGEIEIPQPKAGEVLIRIHAAAITRDELDWPVNRLPAIPSYEFSGTVAALGQGVGDLAEVVRLAEAQRAFELSLTRHRAGKIVLLVTDD